MRVGKNACLPDRQGLEMFSDVADGLKRVKNYKVWQDGNHPILLFSNEVLQQKLDYLPVRQAGVHMNLVVAEFVDEPEYYWYSSARGLLH